MQKFIRESASSRVHLKETPSHLNSTVLLIMQQHTKWTEDQIAKVYFALAVALTNRCGYFVKYQNKF